MNQEYWLDERAKLQSILDDIDAGHIVLRNGEVEYLDTLKARLASLDEKLAGGLAGHFVHEPLSARGLGALDGSGRATG